MRDVMYVLATLGIFALCVALVRACDLLVGPDDDDLSDVTAAEAVGAGDGTGIAVSAGATS